MWDLYDALIDGIPSACVVDDVLCGAYAAVVRSGEGTGLCMLSELETRPPLFPHKRPGTSLRELASCVKSWNYVEASIGQAAINAYYNAVPVALGNGVDVSAARYVEDRKNDPFIAYQQAIRGQKVAVVGHFHLLEELFAPVCELYILEDQPEEDGDYPCTAAEYILPQCAYVFITCGALTDKSFPRFLALAQKAYVVVVGPSTPMAPVLFDYGVNDLAGFVVKDGQMAVEICAGRETSKIYATGQKVSLKTAATPR
ncbi:MAG: DUF364 domain-containing protein [Ethanoligenens sp.]